MWSLRGNAGRGVVEVPGGGAVLGFAGWRRFTASGDVSGAAPTDVDAPVPTQYPQAHPLPARWTAHFDAVPRGVFHVMRTIARTE